MSSQEAVSSVSSNSIEVSSALSPNMSDSYTPPPSPSKLHDAVRKQIEYYFSRENLVNDQYLMSQMDAQMSVQLSVIMKFPKMQSLTQDISLIREALVGSSVSIVEGGPVLKEDGTQDEIAATGLRLKANIKSSGRSTIILRDIPSDAPDAEVKEIFNFKACKPITSVRSEIGDTWFVFMESETDAKDTLLGMRLEKRTFRGKPVKPLKECTDKHKVSWIKLWITFEYQTI